jgi:RcsF protein
VSIPLYKNNAELNNKSVKNLGEVSGTSCQISLQDPPPSLRLASKNMQDSASISYSTRVNGILLESCQIVGGMGGCYQQAICQGSALNISAK